MAKKSYKQAFMKEFNVTSEEYDKLYDVYALRARRYEKIHNVKLNNANDLRQRHRWVGRMEAEREMFSP